MKAWLLKKAELALADMEEYRSKWGWSFKPSEAERINKMVERRKRWVTKLGGNPDE